MRTLEELAPIAARVMVDLLSVPDEQREAVIERHARKLNLDIEEQAWLFGHITNYLLGFMDVMRARSAEFDDWFRLHIQEFGDKMFEGH